MKKLFAGAKIRALRNSHDLTQQAMARRLGLSTSYLNQLENDTRPLTTTALLQLVDAFDVPATYFSPHTTPRITAALIDALPAAHPSHLADLTTRHPELSEAILKALHAATPRDPYAEVRDFFSQHNNYFPTLEETATALAARLGEPPLRLTAFAAIIERELTLTVKFRHHAAGPRLQLHDGTVSLRTGITEAQATFELALLYFQRRHHAALADLATELDNPEARPIAEYGLAQYAAAATVLPYDPFLAHAREVRYDVDKLCYTWGTSLEMTCQRLSSLHQPGKSGVPFFFIRIDRAGNISKRQSATSFHIPSMRGTCPLWVIHRAFDTPGRFVRQVAELPDGAQYLWVARTVTAPGTGFGEPPREYAIGLGCTLREAADIIYADGLDLSGGAATAIGPGCSTCPRNDCRHRASVFLGAPSTPPTQGNNPYPYSSGSLG